MSIIFTFPPELKVHLFKYFTLYKLLQMRLVSRQWKAMIETVGSFERELWIVEETTEVYTTFNSLILNSRRFDADEPPPTSPDGAHFISTLFPIITDAFISLDYRDFSLPNCFNASGLLRDWADSLTYLSIDLEGNTTEVSNLTKFNQLLEFIGSRLPELKQFHFNDYNANSNIKLPKSFPVLGALEQLTLSGSAFKEEGVLADVLGQVSPSLKKLTIDNLPDELPASTIAKLSPSLTALNIYGMEVNGAVFCATLRRLQGITYLDLYSVTDFSLLYFPDLMTFLVDLPQLNTFCFCNFLLYHKCKPPYSYPAHPAVRQLYIQSYRKLSKEMLQLASVDYAFPNVDKVTIAAIDVHQVRPFLRIDDDIQTLENYVKRHFGEQTEVKLINMGHRDEEDEELEYDFSGLDDFDEDDEELEYDSSSLDDSDEDDNQMD